MQLRFHEGTVELRDTRRELNGGALTAHQLSSLLIWDGRTECFRAPAFAYAEIVMACVRRGLRYEDQARAYEVLSLKLHARKTPRPFQQEALDHWWKNRGQGVVALPTGAGKTYVAIMAIERAARSALVVVPTLDLVRQWRSALHSSFQEQVGVIGGGEHNPLSLTVITYDSACHWMERIGDRFGLVIYDECHHLPSDAYSFAAQSCLAPFRLGLSATPERADGRHIELESLIGPLVYQRDVVELAGDYLAEYTTEQVIIELSESEQRAYDQERQIYRDFVISQGIRMSSAGGWSEFVMRSARSGEGRRAMRAYLNQKRLAFAAPSKLSYVYHLLHLHRRDKTLIFTQNNATAYEVSRRFLIPVITHQTKLNERSEILEGFAAGRYFAVATSKVLNEGVDVPDANVAIVISGSGSVREHVQRLGRILRRGSGEKKAILYELIAGGTAEAYTSARRREHNAYR